MSWCCGRFKPSALEYERIITVPVPPELLNPWSHSSQAFGRNIALWSFAFKETLWQFCRRLCLFQATGCPANGGKETASEALRLRLLYLKRARREGKPGRDSFSSFEVFLPNFLSSWLQHLRTGGERWAAPAAHRSASACNSPHCASPRVCTFRSGEVFGEAVQTPRLIPEHEA